MTLKARKYKFSAQDTHQIRRLGYAITGASSMSFEKFMRTHFPNFDLVSLLEELEDSFSPATTLPIRRTITFNESTPNFHLTYYNEATLENDELTFEREFRNISGAIEIDHIYCVLPEAKQNLGLAKKVFQTSLQQYINMKARRINVHAGLGGGGYVWAKYGFVAHNKHEVEIILKSAKMDLNKADYDLVESVFNNYYAKNPAGRAFPMVLWATNKRMKKTLMGSDWRGELDLKNKEQLRNFTDYVFGT